MRNYTHVNKVRKLFFAMWRQIDRIPLTKVALKKYIKRVAYQITHSCSQSTVAEQHLLSLFYCLSIMNSIGRWIPFWTINPEATKTSCKELMKCNWGKACIFICRTFKTAIPCTELCVKTCYYKKWILILDKSLQTFLNHSFSLHCFMYCV